MNEYYYISDIHIDENMPMYCADDVSDQCGYMCERIEELVESVGDGVDAYGKTLLVAGDTANSALVASRFYAILHGMWNGRIVTVLGNHEIWHEDPADLMGVRHFGLDDILDDYRARCGQFVRVLENNLLLVDVNGMERLLDRETVLDLDDEHLRKLVEEADIAIIGGTGFAAYNPRFNAAGGMYMSKVTVALEQERGRMWEELYDRMLDVCGDLPLVVLTHMKHTDWTGKALNPNWRYVSGHTHSNKRASVDGAVVEYADNQICSGWGKWKLKKFEF